MTIPKRLPFVLVHDGNLSNLNQARALAYGMRACVASTIELNVNENDHEVSIGEGVVVGCGRRAATVTSKFTHGVTKTVQILHPRWLRTTSHFDCLVLPDHDRLGWFDDKSKIVRMQGSLSWDLHKDALDCLKTRSPSKRIGVLLGGDVEVDTLTSLIDDATSKAFEVDIVSSRRTPIGILNFLEARYGNKYNLWRYGSLNPNPYRNVLASNDAFIVSSDSISMLADVLTVHSERGIRPPIFIAKAAKTTSRKHMLSMARISERFPGALFEVSMETSSIVPLIATADVIQMPYESDRVGKLVMEKLGLT